MTRDEELTKAGWEKRFVTCEPRLTEMVEAYRQIGLEVHLEPLPQKKDIERIGCSTKDCTICFDQDSEKYRTIYTRPGRSGTGDESL